MINLMKINSTELAGLEWDLSKHSQEQNSIIRPSKNIIYENSKGGYSMRFYEYRTKNKEESEEEDELALINESYDPIKDEYLANNKRTKEWYDYQFAILKKELIKKGTKELKKKNKNP